MGRTTPWCHSSAFLQSTCSTQQVTYLIRPPRRVIATWIQFYFILDTESFIPWTLWPSSVCYPPSWRTTSGIRSLPYLIQHLRGQYHQVHRGQLSVPATICWWYSLNQCWHNDWFRQKQGRKRTSDNSGVRSKMENIYKNDSTTETILFGKTRPVNIYKNDSKTEAILFGKLALYAPSSRHDRKGSDSPT